MPVFSGKFSPPPSRCPTLNVIIESDYFGFLESSPRQEMFGSLLDQKPLLFSLAFNFRAAAQNVSAILNVVVVEHGQLLNSKWSI